MIATMKKSMIWNQWKIKCKVSKLDFLVIFGQKMHQRLFLFYMSGLSLSLLLKKSPLPKKPLSRQLNFQRLFFCRHPTPRHFFIYPLAALAALAAFPSFTSSVIFAFLFSPTSSFFINLGLLGLFYFFHFSSITTHLPSFPHLHLLYSFNFVK